MDEAVKQAYARLNVHEWMLEVMMANWVATMSEAEAETFFDDMKLKSKSKWAVAQPAVDDGTMFQILRDADELAEHFIDKVRRRASDIRAELA